MSNFAQQAHSSTANFLVNGGFAVRVPAASLSAEHVGRALMNEVWRDHEFLHISGITAGDGIVTIEYLKSETKPAVKTSAPLDSSASCSGTVATEVTETIVTKHSYSAPIDSEIVITPAVTPRPVGRRLTRLITTVSSEEPLEDVVAAK